MPGFTIKLHNGQVYDANNLAHTEQNSGTEGRIPMLTFVSANEMRVVRADSVAEVLWHAAGVYQKVG
jgi:hypothetical protein